MHAKGDKNGALPNLAWEFGRVVSRPELHDGRPHLKKKFGTVEVFCILDQISNGTPDDEICARYPGLDRVDIDSCRAYAARFLPDPAHDNAQNVFLLDENASYLILPDIVRLFGKSSHVLAEGLKNADDEKDIWAHLVTHKYQAILTSDIDFKNISRHYRRDLAEKYGKLQDCPEHIPTVVYIKKHLSYPEFRAVLTKHQDAIKRFLAENDTGVLSVNENEAARQYDLKELKEKAVSIPQTCPSSPPSGSPAP